jgi:hypothetical protein
MRLVKSVESFDQKVDADIAYRLKAKRSPTSEILSWLLTNGELVPSGLISTESSTINNRGRKQSPAVPP